MPRNAMSESVDTPSFSSRRWGLLPHIGTVTAHLSQRDEQFLQAVGTILSAHGETSRIAVTLLHSHFQVEHSEVLVERFDQSLNLIVTTVHPREDLNMFSQLVPKSWKVCQSSQRGIDGRIEPLTYIEASELVQRPLGPEDEPLVRCLTTAFVSFDVTERFGLAHPGRLPSEGTMWVEGEQCTDRYLVQEQIDRAIVESRDPIRTMWLFDAEGKYIITLGCCRRTRDGKSHTGTVHPVGW
jgi:hypothetical protein